MKAKKAASCFLLLPLLSCGDPHVVGKKPSSIFINSLPPCAPGEFLVYTTSGIACMTLNDQVLPDCSSSGLLLTVQSSGETSGYACTTRGTTSVGASEVSTINSNYQALVNMGPVITSLETSTPSGNAQYCGSTSAISGRILTGTALGIPAATNLCSQIPACGAAGRMCTVYDLYFSVARGVIKSTDTIQKAWVYMGSWQNFSTTAAEPTSGLNDNCGSYTYNGTTSGWYGTAVKWENDAAGDRVLKFYTGPDQSGIGSPMGNYEGAPCNVPLPIACCK